MTLILCFFHKWVFSFLVKAAAFDSFGKWIGNNESREKIEINKEKSLKVKVWIQEENMQKALESKNLNVNVIILMSQKLS